jgi:hypothetical protein
MSGESRSRAPCVGLSQRLRALMAWTESERSQSEARAKPQLVRSVAAIDDASQANPIHIGRLMLRPTSTPRVIAALSSGVSIGSEDSGASSDRGIRITATALTALPPLHGYDQPDCSI